ncbi:MarR family winged helix-turn-helix transcriptional regulator [Demequina flava]|uniref:MarR family winged helix-turn-helix transcriptional regulator n=1 Tax=Demequina flava TaxID=1095025 RepID=UPI0007822E5B|nr:MarR family winged helix-turn-helix transcriptional regulator [Demequina flava]
MTRAAQVGSVLESLVMWQRRLASLPAPPFAEAKLSRAQVDVLFMLAHGPADVTPGVLATQLGVTRGAVSQLLEPLVAEGLAEQVQHPHDARSRLIRLTDSARGVVADFESAAATRMTPFFEALDDSEMHALADLLGRTIEETP